jgi:hypothetical protein
MTPEISSGQNLLLADKLHDYLSRAGSIVEIDQDDLLPGAEIETTVIERKSQRGLDEKGTQMRKTVTVAPCLVMRVSNVGRDHLLHEPWDILQQTWLIFHCAHCGGGSPYRNRAYSLFEIGLINYGGYIGGYIMNAAKAFGVDLDGISE